ncbi:hypothetical protein HG530_012542 [Fusarium avenaceum]|nr:hypothetical protein HG530_012542 [Fusarium avenaceum]
MRAPSGIRAARLLPLRQGVLPARRLLSVTRRLPIGNVISSRSATQPLLGASVKLQGASPWCRSYSNVPNKATSRIPISVDGVALDFSSVLLRDSCQCPLCVHEFTNQRLFSVADIPSNIRARSVQVDTASEQISIKWENDTTGLDEDHTTRFTIGDMRELAKSGSLPGFGRDIHDAQILWTKEPLPNLQDFDYDRYMNDDEEVYKLIHQLRTDGLAFVTNIPGKVESLATIAERIGPVQDTFYGRTWDVRTVPEPSNAAYTSADLGFHTDLLYFQNPPHVQLLHCVQSASSGGASVFADAYRSAVDLFHQDPEAFETLATIPVNYHYNHPNDNVYRTTKPVIDLKPLRIGNQIYHRVQDYAKDYHELSFKNGGTGWDDAVLVDHMLKINWGPPFLAPFSNHQDSLSQKDSGHPPLSALNSKVDMWHEGALKFNALLQRSEYLYERKMNSGDCVLFDNTRTLHSRRAFDMADVGKPRWLRGTYVDKDSYFSWTKQQP